MRVPGDIIEIRMLSHGLDNARFSSPAELIRHFGCIQAQDTRQARWVVGSRVTDATDLSVREALARGEMIRTWPMRGTLHFTDPKRVHMLLSLCASKTLSGFAKRRAFLGISDAHAEQAIALMQKHMRNKILTRSELGQLFVRNGIPVVGQWVYHLACYAATKGIICFGPPNDNEDTFVLLDEWISASKALSRESQLAELARMYVRGHGPATIDDLAWWSGLGKTECVQAMNAIKGECESLEMPSGKTGYFYRTHSGRSHAQPRVRLLGGFDEYFLGYKDRSPVADVAHHVKLFTMNGIFFPIVLVDGRAAGSWKREVKKDVVRFSFSFLHEVKPPEKDLKAECARYASFLGYQKHELI